MCELLGMSGKYPADICFSFSGLMERGGKTGPHKDGWGIAFYEGKGCRIFHDKSASSESEVAKLVKRYPIKSDTVVCHIRKANRGRVCLENTHPFIRHLWGRNWVYAHNGQLKGVKKLALDYFEPIGTTDSEHAFCWMMDKIQEKFPEPPRNPKLLWKFIKSLCDELSQFGVFNILFCDSKYLYVHCSTKIVWIQRKFPLSVGEAKLVDTELTIDFRKKMKPEDVITVIATAPLTHNEEWNKANKGDFLVFHEGELQAYWPNIP